MRRDLIASVGTIVVILLGLAALWGYRYSLGDPAAAPELSLPPALVAPDQLGTRRPVFDGQSTAGWTVDGPYVVSNGTLELGGPEAVKAVLQQSLEEGQQLEFDFFQEGPAGAKLWVKPTLLDPQPPDPDYCKEFSYDLNLSEFLYKRWHTVRIAAAQQGTDMQVAIDIEPQHGGPGRGGGARHSLPARGGCRHQLVFEVAAGSKLYLRNILLDKRDFSE